MLGVTMTKEEYEKQRRIEENKIWNTIDCPKSNYMFRFIDDTGCSVISKGVRKRARYSPGERYGRQTVKNGVWVTK
mgnify:CR=1 FL=1